MPSAVAPRPAARPRAGGRCPDRPPLATGLGSLLLGHPFLTTHTAHVSWPLVGEVHLPTAAIFDLGVFAVVVGSTLLLLTAIAHQSLRARRRQGLVPAEGRDG